MQAILGAALLWAAGAGTLLRQNPDFYSQALVSLALYVLATGAVWLAGHPGRMAVSWALSGWRRAHDMLQETRERRGELYRALRALEEATYRLLQDARTQAEHTVCYRRLRPLQD